MITANTAFSDISDFTFEKLYKSMEIDEQDGTSVCKIFENEVGAMWSVGYFKTRQGWKDADLHPDIIRDIQACIDLDLIYLVTWIIHWGKPTPLPFPQGPRR